MSARSQIQSVGGNDELSRLGVDSLPENSPETSSQAGRIRGEAAFFAERFNRGDGRGDADVKGLTRTEGEGDGDGDTQAMPFSGYTGTEGDGEGDPEGDTVGDGAASGAGEGDAEGDGDGAADAQSKLKAKSPSVVRIAIQ